MRKTSASPAIRVLEAIGAAFLVVMMVTVFVDVIGRNVLNMPLPWGTEVLEIVLAGMIFVLYPVLAIQWGHITVDLIPVRAAVQKFQRVLGAGMGALLFGIICGCLVRQTVRAAGYGEATATLGAPIAWILGTMAALAAVTSLCFLVAMARAFGGVKVARSVERELEALS
ncbi:MAG TPA: TRAP transporter small permease [Burkholderiaceae bacterium]